MTFATFFFLIANIYSVSATAPTHNGVFELPVVHSTNEVTFGKRAVEMYLTNRSDVAYYALLHFGTPPQPQYVQLDTGSFELWINPSCSTSDLSRGDRSFCLDAGQFSADRSSSFVAVSDQPSRLLQYGIGNANITYGRDDIVLAGIGTASPVVLSGVQFGVATATTDLSSGILGIGYGEGATTRYPNFVDELQRQNVTAVKVFSLALGSKAERRGGIVFGGVDTSKFAGSLTRLHITPASSSPDSVPRYWVNMTSLSLSPSPSSSFKTYANSSIQVFLDSGSTLTLLPTALAKSIAADFNAIPDPDSGYATVDCGYLQQPGTLNFAFGSVVVHVPFRELIRQAGAQCMLGIRGSDNFVLLGDTFLRSAYVVFDQDNNDIWMAQYVNCGSSPQAMITADSLAIAKGICSPVQGSVNNFGSPSSINGDANSGASNSSSSPTSTSGQTASTSSTISSSSASSSASSSRPLRPVLVTLICLTAAYTLLR